MRIWPMHLIGSLLTTRKINIIMKIPFEYTLYVKTFIGIIAIVNPIGAIPVFLSLCGDRSPSDIRSIARITATSVAVVLLISAWSGETILSFFGIGIPAFRTGGGLLILLMAIAMMHAKQSHVKRSPEEADADNDRDDVAVVPLAIPLLAGPGAISLIVVDAQHSTAVYHNVMISVCIGMVALAVWVTLRLAEPIGDRMGITGLNVVTRIMGLLLAAIGVQMIADGMIQLFPGLG
jgi:multiple antibiotic resistance protein